MPPAPITRASPNCGSALTPMMSSQTAPVTIRSTSSSSARSCMRMARSRTSSGVVRSSATPPTSVLCADCAARCLDDHRKAEPAAASAASSGAADHALPERRGHAAASSILASIFGQRPHAMAKVLGPRQRGRRRRPRPVRRRWSRPPRRRQARHRGRPLARCRPTDSCSAYRFGQAFRQGGDDGGAGAGRAAALIIAWIASSQPAVLMPGAVGVSRISIATSKPPASTAEKVAVSLSLVVPDEGVVVERIVDRDIVIEGGGDLGARCPPRMAGSDSLLLKRHDRRPAPPRRPSSSSRRCGCPGRAPPWCRNFSVSTKAVIGGHPRDAIALEQRIIKRSRSRRASWCGSSPPWRPARSGRS